MSIQFDLPDDYLKKLISTPFEDVAKAMLKEAAPVLVETTKQAMRDVVQHGGESEMIKSVRATAPKATKTDAFIVNVNPTGYSKNTYNRGKRKYPVSNALKALWLQYGVAGRQPARDWLNKSVNRAEPRVTQILQKVWEEKTDEH